MKIALIGYGKMGKVIEQIAVKRGHSICLTIDRDNQKDFNEEKLKEADVAIEFTTPATAVPNYLRCFDSDVPVVSGTTGWLDKKDVIEKACQEGASFFYASNYSLGVNLFFAINSYVAELLYPYDNYKPEIEEVHHVHKLDAPSGTAITIAEGVIAKYPSLKKWGDAVTNSPDSLLIESKREGEVPGTHIVSYTSAEDVLSIKHEAKGREGFALGAVLAAEFLINQECGWYGMKDLLKIK